jgi:hypothetical protein
VNQPQVEQGSCQNGDRRKTRYNLFVILSLTLTGNTRQTFPSVCPVAFGQRVVVFGQDYSFSSSSSATPIFESR